MDLRNQTITNQELVIKGSEQNFLGADLVLCKCRLILRTSASALTMNRLQLVDCQIETKKKLFNCQAWCGARITGCTFNGHFFSNDFGHWPLQNEYGSIKDCDFSDAILDECRFMGCEIENIKLPRWPCFTILHPHQREDLIKSAPWPEKLEFWFRALARSPKSTVALAGYAPKIITQYGSNEEELREALERLGNVVM